MQLSVGTCGRWQSSRVVVSSHSILQTHPLPGIAEKNVTEKTRRQKATRVYTNSSSETRSGKTRDVKVSIVATSSISSNDGKAGTQSAITHSMVRMEWMGGGAWVAYFLSFSETVVMMGPQSE